MLIEDPVDLSTRQTLAAPSWKKARTSGVRPLFPVFPDCIDHFIPDEYHPHLAALAALHGELLNCQVDSPMRSCSHSLMRRPA